MPPHCSPSAIIRSQFRVDARLRRAVPRIVGAALGMGLLIVALNHILADRPGRPHRSPLCQPDGSGSRGPAGLSRR